ncbi:MAG TPA: lytic murein transglycosylase [Azospirillaceae bacterium]|nr:lytic murein transglycosylase [Azospirillaceae bacterium]
MPFHRRRILQTLAALSALPAALSSRPGLAANKEFGDWLAELRRDAAAQGISRRTIDAALESVAPIPRVLELDRKQPESTITFAQYVERVVSADRIAQGQQRLAEHRDVLERVSAQYGVPARFVVALWGIETSYGQITGNYKIVDALATLAYDGRRSQFFRSELIAALKILDQGHIRPERMLGSWAGAMGQSQFMPSSFLQYAVDFDGDGRRDIWTSRPDVFASAANYLAKNGWNPNLTWGREVQAPPSVRNGPGTGLDAKRPLSAWQAAGVRRTNGGDLPAADVEASLVMPDGPNGAAFLVYDNYRVVMRWNRSTYFATSVGLLADRIGGAD